MSRKNTFEVCTRVKNAANGELSIKEVALNKVELGWTKTLSECSPAGSDVKNLIARASGSKARDPVDSFSYFVAGRTIRAIFGYRADAIRARTRDSLTECGESFAISAGVVEAMSPASNNEDM